MPALVADTHAALWYLQADPRLTVTARETMHRAGSSADGVYISVITLVEARYLTEKGRIHASSLEGLEQRLGNEQFQFRPVALDLAVHREMAKVPRNLVPDMPDRIICATALALGLPLVSCDGKIRLSGLETIW